MSDVFTLFDPEPLAGTWRDPDRLDDLDPGMPSVLAGTAVYLRRAAR